MLLVVLVFEVTLETVPPTACVAEETAWVTVEVTFETAWGVDWVVGDVTVPASLLTVVAALSTVRCAPLACWVIPDVDGAPGTAGVPASGEPEPEERVVVCALVGAAGECDLAAAGVEADVCGV